MTHIMLGDIGIILLVGSALFLTLGVLGWLVRSVIGDEE